MSASPDSQQPSRRPRVWALWWASAGVLVVLALAVAVSPRLAGIALAVHLGLLGLARMVLPAPGPEGIASRSRAFDVAFLWLGAAGTAFMTLTADSL